GLRISVVNALTLLTTALLAQGELLAPPHQNVEPPADDAPVLTLPDALDRVRSRNINLRIAREQLAKSSILSKKAWSVILPVISGSLSGTYNNPQVVLDFRDMIPPELEPFLPPPDPNAQPTY